MMEPGYEKPRNNKNENNEDLLYEIEECNNTHPLDPNQYKMFRNELKLFTIKYICKKIELLDIFKPKLCDLCIYRKKCTNISLTKNKPDYVRLLTMDDLHDMATKAQCYFPDINTQKVIELKIKQLEINKFPFLYHLVTHNCFPIYKKYVVLTDGNNLVDSMDIPDIPLNYEYIFDYDDIEPEKEEVKENKRKFLEVLSDIIDKPFDFKSIITVILLFYYAFSITSIFLSDYSLITKISWSGIDTFLILLAYIVICII